MAIRTQTGKHAYHLSGAYDGEPSKNSPGLVWSAAKNAYVTKIAWEWNKKYGTTGTTTGVGGSTGTSNRLAQIIYEQNQAAEKEMKARDTEQAALNKQAYEAGMMSDEEYQSLESKGFETTRAQFGQVGREFGEQAYGRVNVGALRAGARDIKMREAEAIGGGVRELGMERLRRKSEASRIYAGAEQTRQSLYQAPRYKIPETMGPESRITAISGQAYEPPPKPEGYYYNPATARQGLVGMSDPNIRRW